MTIADWLMKRRRDALIAALPLRSPIFLPTSKIPPAQAVSGLRKVKELYDGRLERVHRPRLKRLREQMAGRNRCFVIGNGPSLNRTDLSLLADEVTFAVNGFFLKSSELGWSPTVYVVEDHLVAEDRADQINALNGPVKLFPANLAYCLHEDDDTIYFDHRPRVSYPDGFDFSMKADRVTYAGCTVTFTCLQLAAYLGFEQIYLIGVDADYAIPSDAHKSDDYGVNVLDMSSDDPNHFDPNYFGKGYRWHDPQVDKMLEAYREAKRVTDQHGIRIFNAGVGGKLEVFPRVQLESLFVSTDGHDELNGRGVLSARGDHAVSDMPRIVIIDMTLMGDGTATGELKANLLGGWGESRILHLFSGGSGRVGVRGRSPATIDLEPSARSDQVLSLLDDFAPDCVIYRPVPECPVLHELAMRYLRLNPIRLIVWIMDDWPERLRRESPEVYGAWDEDLRWLLDRSCARLAISREMAEAFGGRYGVDFVPLANGINAEDWPKPEPQDSSLLVVRYAGALAKDMTYDSVLRVAHVVEDLARAGVAIRFEINTRPLWADSIRPDVRELRSCTITTEAMSRNGYREFLRGADVLLIAYNFDEASKAYVRYSLANKLPECLVSGGVTLVHGPVDVATVSLMADRVPEAVVPEPDVEQLKTWFSDVYHSAEHRVRLAASCRSLAVSEFSLQERSSLLRELIQGTLSAAYTGPIRYHLKHENARIDESALVFQVLGQRSGNTPQVVIGVGAHLGSTMRCFAESGWRVLAFEPDAANRQSLRNSFEGFDNVTIDSRAVAAAASPAEQVCVSSQSSGISGLPRLHESHVDTGSVSVTSIADIVGQHGLDRVDFLKVDAEGFDLAVLRGVPWERLLPSAICCEFDDETTSDLGHTWREIADFLVSKGYQVYVSEWYPVELYGARHDWRSLRRYPCGLYDASARGSLLGFASPLAMDVLTTAVESTVEANVAPLSADTPRQAARFRWSYAGIAEAIRDRSELLFRAGQVMMWTARSIVVKPARAASLIALPAIAVLAVGYGSSSALWRVAIVLVFLTGASLFAFLTLRDFLRSKPARPAESEQPGRPE